MTTETLKTFLRNAAGALLGMVLLGGSAHAWGFHGYEAYRVYHAYHDEHAYDSYRRGHDGRGYDGRKREGLTFPARDALPNPRLTPGAISSAVTQANIDETICRPGGYTRSVRPPESYTEPLKRRLIRAYGYTQQLGDQAFRMGNYELDHLVPLGVGGNPTSPSNLWPQPHNVQGGWGSYAKDRLELKVHDMVCAHQLALAQAQRMMATNWVQAYKKLIGPTPDPRPMRWQER